MNGNGVTALDRASSVEKISRYGIEDDEANFRRSDIYSSRLHMHLFQSLQRYEKGGTAKGLRFIVPQSFENDRTLALFLTSVTSLDYPYCTFIP